MANLLLLHGPNLNLLGAREPEHYGATTLSDINTRCKTLAGKYQHKLRTAQHNSEGELINEIHNATDCAIILFNPAAFTHTSIALRDALLAVKIPFIEIHMTNPYTRETFRHQSYLNNIAAGIISGFGAKSYTLAVQAAIDLLETHDRGHS